MSYLHYKCFSCNRERFSEYSRYCKSCHEGVIRKEEEDARKGIDKDPDYGYTKGMNYGLGVYVNDKEEYKRAVKQAKLEGLEPIG